MLQRVDNVEDRADRLLQQIAKSTERRDALLAEVGVIVERAAHPQSGTVEPLLHDIAEVRDRVLPTYVDQSAELAHTMNECAVLAQHSTTHHARLRTLLTRVQLAKRVAASMMAMEDNVTAAVDAMSANDLGKAVALVKSYEEARRVVTDTATTASSAASAAEVKSSSPSQKLATSPPPGTLDVVDPTIAQVRQRARAELETTLQKGIDNNDKLGIMEAANLLAQLGDAEEAGARYCSWLCDHTAAVLKKMVERELAKMEDPTQAAMTYLVLVSQLLDTIAATFESEEPFVKETFGNRGALRLMQGLHQHSTAQCVPVLAKFRASRQDVLERLLAKDVEVQARLDARQAAFADPVKLPTHTLGDGTVVLVSSGDDDDDDDDRRTAAEDAAIEDEENGRFLTAQPGAGGAVGSSASLMSPPPQGSTARRGGGGGSPSPSPMVLDDAALSRSVADARQADQILEEISHLVSCCDVYLAFAEEKQTTYKALIEKEVKQAAKSQHVVGAETASVHSTTSAVGGTTEKSAVGDTSADAMWSVSDTALLNAVQDMLSLYVPVQVSYFQSAFYHALQLQAAAVRDALTASSAGGTKKSAAADRAGGPASSPAPAASLMAGLSSLYAAAAGGVADMSALNLVGGGSGSSAQSREQALQALEQQQRAYKFYSDSSSVTLAEDVFYFVRVALHRAINTRSTQIASAIVMSAEDLIQRRLLPELRRHAGPHALHRHRRQGTNGRARAAALVGGENSAGTQSAPFLPPPVLLRWTAVTQQSIEYTNRLAEELRRLATTHYKGRDLVRFQELAQDMAHSAAEVRKVEWKPWLAKDAHVCYDGLMSPHLRRLNALSYAAGLTEEVFYHYELNDPWVQACLTDWAALFDYARPLLDSTSADQFIHDVAAHLTRHLRSIWMQKRYNTLGALQLDKEVRALRDFFFSRVQEISLRQVFAPLSLMSTLLLSDTPRDAIEEAQNTALTAEEKKAVLLLRQDFKKEDVMALRL